MPTTTPVDLRFKKFARRFVALHITVLTALPAAAQQMVGQNLLNWAKNYIIAPIGILSVVIALGASVFRPELVKTAAYSAGICAVLFFIIQNAQQFVQAMR